MSPVGSGSVSAGILSVLACASAFWVADPLTRPPGDGLLEPRTPAGQEWLQAALAVGGPRAASPTSAVVSLQNHASRLPGFSPYSLLLIKSPSPEFQSVSTATSVSAGSVSVPVVSARAGEMVVHLPATLSVGFASRLQVRNIGALLVETDLPIDAYSPGIYTEDDSGTGPARAWAATGRSINASNPARAGDTVEILVTGLGEPSTAWPAGQTPPSGLSLVPKSLPEVTVGSMAATAVSAQLDPSRIGVYRVKFVVPDDPAPGDKLLVVRSGRFSSPAVVLPYQVRRAAQCGFSLQTSALYVGAEGADGLSVTFDATGSACPWTVSSTADWLIPYGPFQGTGSAVVPFTVLPYPLTVPRAAKLVVNGVSFLIVQTPAGSSGEEEVREGASQGVLYLDGLDETAFHKAGGDVSLRLEGASLEPVTDGIDAILNGERLADASISVQADRLTFKGILKDGLNRLRVTAVDTDGAILSAGYDLWAGSRTVVARLAGASPQGESPQSAASPAATTRRQERAASDDDLPVTAELSVIDSPRASVLASDDGQGNLKFDNVPAAPLVLSASQGKRLAVVPVSATAATLDLQLRDFAAPSAVDNPAFESGLSGWETLGASARLLADAAHPGVLKAGKPVLVLYGCPVQDAADGSLSAPPSCAAGGTQSVRRTFQTRPGSTAVSLRYFLGAFEKARGGETGLPDSFSITLRSLATGRSVTVAGNAGSFGSAAFDPLGYSSLRELSLLVPPEGDVVEAELRMTEGGAAPGGGQVLDGLFVASFAESGTAISSARLLDLNSDGLQALSVGAHPYSGGSTPVSGILEIDGKAGDSVLRLDLEVLSAGRVVASGALSPDAAALLQPFPASGHLRLAPPGPLFLIPSQDLQPLAEAGGPLQLRIVLRTAGGEVAQKEIETSPGRLVAFRLDEEDASVRFGQREPALCMGTGTFCGGDGWLDPALKPVVEHFTAAYGLQWNDFSNLNGGHYPIHAGHRDGWEADVRHPAYPPLDAAAAQLLVALANDSTFGSRIQHVYVPRGHQASAEFWAILDSAELKFVENRKRFFLKVEGTLGHFHLRFKR